MTPERRAKIDAILQMSHTRDDCDTRFEFRLLQALQDSVAEIDRLNKVVDQALRWIPQIVKDEIQYTEYDGKCNPDLAAELQRRGK